MSDLIAAADILVVDDHDIMRAMLGAVLGAFGVRQTRMANGAAQAWAEIEHAAPDLVLLDQTMPAVSGLEFLQALRARQDLQQPAVLMLTGHEDQGFARQALVAGAQGVLVKPIENEVLLYRIDLALAARARAAERATG
ncbi:MAG: PleD family two-component system response regulator [Hyphomonadaceae bacterium]